MEEGLDQVPLIRIMPAGFEVANASKEQMKANPLFELLTSKGGIFIENIDKELLDEAGNKYVLKIVCRKLNPSLDQ